MWRSTHWIPLLTLLSSAYIIGDVEACFCIERHPQTHFCQSDWVAVVKIRESEEMISDSEVAYKIMLYKFYKADQAGVQAFEKHQMLWSKTDGNMCERSNLKPGETWLLSGMMDNGKPYTSTCDLAIRWSEVTQIHLQGLLMLYGRGCKCTILSEWIDVDSVNSTEGGGCLWDAIDSPKSFCQKNYGICTSRGLAGCAWTVSTKYQQCVLRRIEAAINVTSLGNYVLPTTLNLSYYKGR